jgi:uncharacterized protein YdeI (YjbR/CyaY-like superfamily)
MVKNQFIMNSRLHVKNRKDWRLWLSENHHKEKEIWLIYHKKHTGKPRVPYNDAVEEALCFGWIDSIVKTIDDERYMQKFTPRKAKSNWSDSNKKRVEKLINAGKMTKAGLEKIEIAKINGTWDKIITATKSFEMPIELENGLDINKNAKDFFNKLSASCRRQYIGWIASAKKEETKQKRVKEAISKLSKKQKLGMK